MRSLGPVSLFAGELVRRPARVLLESVAMLFVILLAHAMLRNRWVANAAAASLYVAAVLNRSAILTSALGAIVLVAVLITLISRFGVLAYIAAWFVVFAIYDLPLSLDQSAWFAARSAITAAMIVAIAGWAFYRSLGSRSPFGAAAFD